MSSIFCFMYKNLISWSLSQFCFLPWRKKRSLYHTLVSEIMLQQTTVATVMNHFDRFIFQYPTIFALAQASEEEICIAWKGLGYYRRARSLRLAAIDIVESYGGKIPLDLNLLMKISGIGLYTANAIIAIGGNEEALPVDANLERILSRIYRIEGSKGVILQKKIFQLFSEKSLLKDIKRWGPRQLSEALMDLGRTFCKVKNSLCSHCPVSRHCESYLHQVVDQFPQMDENKKGDKPKNDSLNLLRILVRKKDQILLFKKNQGEWLEGQWELPTYILNCDDPALKQYPQYYSLISDKKKKSLPAFKSTITKYRITNHILELTEKKFFEDFPYYQEKVAFLSLKGKEQNVAISLKKALNIVQEKKN